MIIAYNFPRHISLDYYMAYPGGGECPWPPLYDYAIALISLAAGGGKVVPHIFTVVNAVLPVLGGVACIFLVHGIARMLWEDKRIAQLSSLLLVCMSTFLMKSMVNSGDHHVFEVLLWLWFIYYSLSCFNIVFGDMAENASAFRSGILMAMGMLLWQGQIFFYTVWFLYIIFLLYRYRDNARACGRIASFAVITGMTASLIHALVRFTLPRGSEHSVFNYNYFSYFQPVYVMFFSLAAGAAYILAARPRTFKRSGLWIACMLIFGSLILFFFKSFREGIFSGIAFLTTSDPWLASISEFQPLINVKQFGTLFSPGSLLADLQGLLTIIIYLLPVFIAVVYFVRYTRTCAKREAGENVSGDAKGFFYLNVFILGILPHYQVRWFYAYAPFLAISMAVFSYDTAGFIMRRISPALLTASKKFTVAVFGTGLVISSVFLFRNVNAIVLNPDPSISPDEYRTYLWIRDNTPKTAHLWTPDKRPEYAVLSFWDKGHFIQYFAERPTVVNNFGHHLAAKAFSDSIGVWAGESEDVVSGFCKAYGVRFVLMNDPIYYLPMLAAYARIDYKRFFAMAMTRMMEYDGSESRNGPALRQFRLIYESGNDAVADYHVAKVKENKLYEFVPGARLSGKVRPNTAVTVKARFRTKQQREFLWESSAVADKGGGFTITVPYATSDDNYEVKALTPYKVRTGGRTIDVHVSGNDVYSGKKLVVFNKN